MDNINDKKVNDNKKVGFIMALKTIFGTDKEIDENDKDVQKEVANLNAQSSSTILDLQEKILSDSKYKRAKLREDLKPKKVEKLDANSSKKVKEKDDDLVK